MFTKDELMALPCERVHAGFQMMVNGASHDEIEAALYPEKVTARKAADQQAQQQKDEASAAALDFITRKAHARAEAAAEAQRVRDSFLTGRGRR